MHQPRGPIQLRALIHWPDDGQRLFAGNLLMIAPNETKTNNMGRTNIHMSHTESERPTHIHIMCHGEHAPGKVSESTSRSVGRLAAVCVYDGKSSKEEF